MSLGYRDAFNDCYGTDLCVCKDDQGDDTPCDFTTLQSQVNAARATSMVVSILAEVMLVVGIVGAVKHRAFNRTLALALSLALSLALALALALALSLSLALSGCTCCALGAPCAP